MAPLKNPRHERFCQALLEGLSATDAHERAGYERDDGNAARLRANPKVVERLAELQAEVAKDTKVTVESLLSELEEARAKAVSLDQMSAAVKSISEKARISGLMVQKIEVGGPGDFSGCSNAEAIVDELLKYSVNPYHDLRDEDRQALLEMFRRQTAETHEFIEAIKRRPYLTANAPKQLAYGNGKNGR
jgi:phage terminase small subunit